MKIRAYANIRQYKKAQSDCASLRSLVIKPQAWKTKLNFFYRMEETKQGRTQNCYGVTQPQFFQEKQTTAMYTGLGNR